MVLGEIRRLKIGDPLDDDTEYGPLISGGASRARATRSSTRRWPTARSFWPAERFPTNPRTASTICRRCSTVSSRRRAPCLEEIFGPVLTSNASTTRNRRSRAPTRRASASPPTSGPSNVDRALRVAEKIKTGMVWVNSFFLRDLRTRSEVRSHERARPAGRPLQHGILDRAQAGVPPIRTRGVAYAARRTTMGKVVATVFTTHVPRLMITDPSRAPRLHGPQRDDLLRRDAEARARAPAPSRLRHLRANRYSLVLHSGVRAQCSRAPVAVCIHPKSCREMLHDLAYDYRGDRELARGDRNRGAGAGGIRAIASAHTQLADSLSDAQRDALFQSRSAPPRALDERLSDGVGQK